MKLKSKLLNAGLILMLFASTINTPANANIVPSEDNLTCAVYLDIAAHDLTPADGLTERQAIEKLLVSRIHLAIMTIQDSRQNVVDEFIDERSSARLALAKQANLDPYGNYTTEQLVDYAKGIAKYTESSCPKVKWQLEQYVKEYGGMTLKQEVALINELLEDNPKYK